MPYIEISGLNLIEVDQRQPGYVVPGMAQHRV